MKLECDIVAPVFLEYKKTLARFIQSRVNDPLDSEELLSEVMMKIYEHCEKLDQIKNMESWLIVVARNTVHDYFRKRHKVGDLKEKALPDISNDEEDFMNDLIGCVPVLIKKLPQKYAGPLLDHEYEGFKIKSLTKKYSLSESGVKSRIQRGRKMLRELFIEYCGKEINSPLRGDGRQRRTEWLSCSDCSPEC
jgi:RNA polymerase sigma-70 factor, ECF subfamily